MLKEKFVKFIKSDSPPKVFFKYYLVIVFFGGLLLWTPFATNDGVTINIIDAIFTATSAVSVTGLSTVSTIDTFSTFGQVIIMLLIICGGLGIMAIKASLFLLLKLKIDNKDRQLIMNEQQHFYVTGMAKLVKQIFLITFIVTSMGMILLTTRFYYHYDMSLGHSIWFGIFHSVSAINNAGFDLFGNSLIGFKDDYFVQTVFMLLIIFGGIGFPVIVESTRYVKMKLMRSTKLFKFSLFTKLTVSTYFIILLFGFLFIFFAEYKHGLAYDNNTFSDKIYLALFQSITTRNAGFATTDIANFSNPTILIMTIMMFIGAAPSSTGGGIRTTTFAVIILSVYNKALNRKNVIVMKRKLPAETISNSYLTFTLAIFIVIFATTVILLADNNSTTNTLFEVASAFGTTGLSTGITASLSIVSKITLIFVMFTGQIGLTTMLGVWRMMMLKNKIILMLKRMCWWDNECI